MESKTNTTKRVHRYTFSKLIKNISILLLFAMATHSYAQIDSCSAHAYFTVATTDYKNLTITNHSTGNNLAYLWHFGDGTSSTVANPGTHTYANAEDHSIYLSVRDTIKNCSSFFADTVYSPCSAVFYFNQDKHSFYFIQQSPDSLNTLYSWDFGDGGTSHAKNPFHSYVNAGSYHVCLTVSSTIDTSCSDTRCYDVTVSDVVPCQAAFTITLDSINNTTFTVHDHSTGDNLSYLWNFGDGTTSTSPSPGPHTYSGNHSYTICLTVTNLLTNCSSTYCEVAYNNSCSAQYMFYNTDGFTYNFAVEQHGHNTFLWNFGDGTTSTEQNVQHTFSSSQSYNVCLIVRSTVDLNCGDTLCRTIDVNIPRYCKALYTIAPDSSTTDPYDFLIYNLSSGSNLTYLWNFGDGTTSTLSNPTHDFAGTGPYIICLSVNNDSCHNVYCDTLDLSDTVHHLLPGKFHVTVVNKTTGIKKNTVDEATLSNYPNPFNGTTTISYGIFTSSRVELEVYNLLGVKVAAIEAGSKAPGTYTLEWDAQHLQEGIYLLQLRTNDQLITKKVIISK